MILQRNLENFRHIFASIKFAANSAAVIINFPAIFCRSPLSSPPSAWAQPPVLVSPSSPWVELPLVPPPLAWPSLVWPPALLLPPVLEVSIFCMVLNLKLQDSKVYHIFLLNTVVSFCLITTELIKSSILRKLPSGFRLFNLRFKSRDGFRLFFCHVSNTELLDARDASTIISKYICKKYYTSLVKWQIYNIRTAINTLFC